MMHGQGQKQKVLQYKSLVFFRYSFCDEIMEKRKVDWGVKSTLTMFRAAGPGSAERILGEISRTTSQMLIVFNLVLSIALSQDFTNGEYNYTMV